MIGSRLVDTVHFINASPKLLAELDGRRILYFQPLGRNKYELFARAKDSERTVFVLRNGAVRAATNDELPAEVL